MTARRARLIAGALGLGVVLAPGLAGREARTATISGITVDDLGRPIANATIAAYVEGDTGEARASARSDALGVFALANLPPGRYTVDASANGHVTVAFGQMLLSSPPVIVPIQTGTRRDIRVVLPRAAVITGTVTDPDGVPVPNEDVQALRWVARLGRRELQSVATARTNSRGAYRLFGLAPGSYVVATAPRSRDNDLVLTPDGRLAASPPSYYPAGPAASSAQTLVVGPGMVMSGIDLRTTLEPAGTIAIDTLAPPGRELRSARGEWQPAGNFVDSLSSMQRRHASGRGSGPLVLVGVPAGRHLVTVRGDVRAEAGQPPPLPLFGAAEVVTTGGTNRVPIALESGTLVTGKFTLRGTSPLPDPALLRGQLVGVSGPFGPTAYGWMRSETTVFGFTIRGVPRGDYRLALSAPEPWRVESATAGAFDLLDGALPVQPGYEVPTIEVALTDRRTSLTGTLRDDAGIARYDRLLVVFPVDPGKRTLLSRWIATTQPDIDGHFSIADLPAGDYFVAAAAIDWDPALEPDRLIALETDATRVTLARGQPVTLDLTVNRQAVNR